MARADSIRSCCPGAGPRWRAPSSPRSPIAGRVEEMSWCPGMTAMWRSNGLPNCGFSKIWAPADLACVASLGQQDLGHPADGRSLVAGMRARAPSRPGRPRVVRSSSEVRLGADSCSRGEHAPPSCCSASRRSWSSGAPPDAQARRSRAARGAAHALRRRARVARAARRLRLRRSRGGRRGGSRVLGAARPPRGRRRRRRVRPGAGAVGLRGGR
jgi:hypothetical protein